VLPALFSHSPLTWLPTKCSSKDLKFKNVAAGKAETERRMLRQTKSENAKTVACHPANVCIKNITTFFIFIYLKNRLLKLHR